MAKGISLHLGLNCLDPRHYAGWAGPLNACEADAEDMQAVAKGRGFATRRFATDKVTRALVRSQIEQISGELNPGDTFFLTYAGHGGMVPDENGDEIDGQDETWCLYDGQLLDDELFQLWARFAPGVRIIVLSDSCHSGTVLRDIYASTLVRTGALASMLPDAVVPAVRQMPRDVALGVYRRNREFYDNLQASIPRNIEHGVKASVLLVSGCQDNQTSLDGTFNGLFTATLLRVWKKGSFTGDYRAFHKAIVERMPPTQTPNYFTAGKPDIAFERQLPFTI